MTDGELKEKLHQMTLMLERVHSDYEMLTMHISGVDANVNLLKNELTMPSGKVTQRFSKLEKQIEDLGAKSTR